MTQPTPSEGLPPFDKYSQKLAEARAADRARTEALAAEKPEEE